MGQDFCRPDYCFNSGDEKNDESVRNRFGPLLDSASVEPAEAEGGEEVVTPQSIIVQADSLTTDGNLQRCLDLLAVGYTQFPRDAGIAWRLARAQCQLAAAVGTVDEGTPMDQLRETRYREALSKAELAVQLDPNCAPAYCWAGIALGGVCKYLSAGESIRHAHAVRDYFTYAVKLNPTDGVSLNALGAWHYAVANLGFVEKMMARVLFTMPPESSYAEAEKWLLKCAEVDPTNIICLTPSLHFTRQLCPSPARREGLI
eukprot:NODE_3699_length_1174_cov_98.178877_g3514_i0.p1 GENE.NODE_3699_length_1174_cov_98.178877_g3514_i0~~NODE_3699_length_1174_cov_98.178877_g3514_i0.p1  ORF type:complete len:259 (-),score=20.08 NODE_3699_length_1174_cov_98.178877_g3514_i0:316-1092(-)